MTSKVLADVLGKYCGAEREGDVLRVAPKTTIGLFASVGDQTLTIQRVVECEFLQEALVVMTHRKERYILAYEDVRALHVGPPGDKKTGY